MDEFKMNAYELPVWQMNVDEVKALIETNRQQANRIAELEDKLSFYELKDLDATQTKPLSDEEITKLHLECWDEIEFARAIEAKVRKDE